MPVKVDLHPDVVWFLRHRCSPAERQEFVSRLEAIRREPIGQSEPMFDPSLSRFVLRFFRFGDSRAIFQFDAGKSLIRVRECRKLKPLP